MPLPWFISARRLGSCRSLIGARCRFPLRFILFLGLATISASRESRAQASQETRPVATGLVVQVKDPSGAILPKAQVILRRTSGAVVSLAQFDASGRYRLALPPAGRYRLTVSMAGFEPIDRALRVGDAAVGPITLTMKLARVDISVVVSADTEVEVVAPDRNKDAASVSANDIRTLPILDGDILSTLSTFLDAGVAGETGPTLVVDGVEKSTLGVAPSAVQRVSINQDPYSAQYTTPGRGQIDVVTKVAADKLHGQANFSFRDSALDARNFFSITQPPEQHRIYDAYITGPVRPLRQTTFLFSLYRTEEDAFNQVHAITAPGVTLDQNVAAPERSTGISMKFARQYNSHHSGYGIYEMYRASSSDQTVGGLNLASTGYTAYNFDQDIIFHDDLTISATKLNQFTLMVEDNDDTTASDVQAPQVVVEGAFTGGGGQNDSVQTEYNPKIYDVVSWTLGGPSHTRHQMKFGVQIPNVGRRVIEDFTNRQGTYTFASLAAYQANTPVTFSLQQGQSRFITHYAQPGAFWLDQIQATPKLTVTPGLRYDWQNALPGTMNGLQPRLSLAYLLDKKRAMVVRVGSGLYIRRLGANIGQDLARYEYASERSLLLTKNLCYPNILACNPLAAQSPNLINFQPGIQSPEQAYFGLSLERQIVKGGTLTLAYNGYRGWHALRAIDVNAPLPPFTSTWRPNASYGQVLQLNSGGYQKSDGLTVSFRGRIGKFYTGFAQYTLQHTDSNTENSFFHPQNQYQPNDEWSRSSTDQRHKLSMLGTFLPEHAFNFGYGLYANSATPYTAITGTDDYHDGLVNARPPGVPRNSLSGGSYEDLELKTQYTFKARPRLKDASPKISLSLSLFNALNAVNYQSYVPIVSSPLYQQPTTAGPPRRLELGASYSF